MARRQEQEQAREEISEVAPNVARLELPIRMPGLGHVNCYALIDGNGAAVVDPGLPGPASWRAIVDRLGKADLAVRNVHTVIVTHSHPDHFGGAEQFARESGARIVAHRSFGQGMWFEASEPEVSVDDLRAQKDAERREPDAAPKGAVHSHAQMPAPSVAARYRRGYRTPWGGKPPRPPFSMLWRRRYSGWRRGTMIPKITHPVEYGDVLDLAGREFHVLHTPGHTMDHICLHDPEYGVFLSGDHVLPTITPHISGLSSGKDPLNLFFYALDRVGEIQGVKRVLPAHGHPFADLHERADAIKRHHRDRLARLQEISRDIGRPATVQEFSEQLFPKRSWGPMAEAETYAHLEHMRLAGEAEFFLEAGTMRYRL